MKNLPFFLKSRICDLLTKERKDKGVVYTVGEAKKKATDKGEGEIGSEDL